MMLHKTIYIILSLFLGCTGFIYAENIDPNNDGSQYAYGENIGWVNFEPNIAGPNIGATVSSNKLTGFIWAENIGWINIDPNDNDPNTGVKNNGTGTLSGYAWGENIGWINFNPNVSYDPNHYGVKINSDGNFSGWAWGENVGWLNFQSVDLFGHNVKAGIVSFEVQFNVIEKTRIGRTLFRYICTVTTYNASSVAVEDVLLEIIEVPDNINVIDPCVTYEHIEAQGSATSDDTCSFAVNRAEPIDPNRVILRATYKIAGGNDIMQQEFSCFYPLPSVITLYDFTNHWLWKGSPGSIPEDIIKDGCVNFLDFAKLAENWMNNFQ
jgi:hypothetical protein